MKITLGFSPCPNDTFIFDALVNNKIDTAGISFDVQLEDVETLNRLALSNTLDITKLSYGTWPLVIKNYILLNSGSALGSGVGPLLIARENISPGEVEGYNIAIPGKNTTAHMLFSLAFPNAKSKTFLRYNEIEDYVLDKPGKVAGVIIHENRFTYGDKGLRKIIDLGKFWEDRTGYPIPLGGIVAKRELDEKLSLKIDDLIRQSIQYAFDKYPLLPAYVVQNSMEMEESIMRKHIDLYVNDFSLDLGINGKQAIKQLLYIFDANRPGRLSADQDLFLKDR